jgi:leucyl-tRNA---protein transferase
MSGKRTLRLYASDIHPCQYLPDRVARTVFVDPAATLDPATQTVLQHQGLRRSGPYLYRPGCDGCDACKSLRVPVAGFAPNRSQERCWQRNHDLQLRWTAARFDAEHVRLYRSYLEARHSDSPMLDGGASNPDMEFLMAGWAETSLLEIRLQGRLLAAAVTDHVADGLSAVYTFYSPLHPQRGLGSFAILCQIEWARLNGLPYVYLGYWIAEAPAMRYKARFRPCEVLEGSAWQQLADTAQ